MNMSDNDVKDMEDLLYYLDRCIEDKRQILTKLCHSKELLFKPWPKPEEKEVKASTTTEQEEIYTPEEKDGLTMINDLLKKAQKAILIQDRLKKKNEAENRKDKTEGKDKVIQEISNKSSQDNQDQQIVSDESKNADKVKSIKETCADKNHGLNGKSVKNHSQSKNYNHTNNSQTKSNASSKSYSSVRRTESKVHSSSKPASNILPTSSDISNKNRPSSRNSASSTSSRLGNRQKKVPVHMTAPFKTDPTIKVSKRPSSRQFIKPERIAKSKYMNSLRQPSSTMNSTVSKSQTVSSKLKGNTSTKLVSNQPNKNSSAEVIAILPTSQAQITAIADVSSENNNGLDSKSDLDIEKLATEVEELLVDEVKDVNKEEKPDIPKAFSLFQEGSSLQVPVKFKKLLNQNRKLRQNVLKEAVTKKVGNDSRDNFLHKIESMSDKDNDLSVQYRKLQCLEVHKKLLQLLQDLQLETVNELSTHHDVLHAKMMVEFILTTYHEMEEETRQIFKGSKIEKSSHQHIVVKPSTSSVTNWLPSHISSAEYQAPNELVYRSRKEIQKYTSAYFNFQWLQMQKTILSTVKSDLLNELKNMDPNTREFIPMYRGIYSLLTCHGNFLPSAIQES